MLMAWGQKVSEEFRNRTLIMCLNLGWKDTMAGNCLTCFAWETGRTFSPSVVNGAGSGAVGLIQFMPATAKGLGTTTAELATMTAVKQLDYVEKYFKPYASKVHDLYDLYMTILYPAYVGKPDDTVVFANGTKAYQQNMGFDKNKDGAITKAEVCARIQSVYDEGMLPENVFNL